MQKTHRINTRDLSHTQKHKIFNLNTTIPNSVRLVDPFGLPTEYVLTHPYMVVYVDKIGSNTNQKMDELKGGGLFAVQIDQQEIGALGLAVDNHFTVLIFTTGTGNNNGCCYT
jgi:hypothetical protein